MKNVTKIWRKFKAIIRLEILDAPKRLYVWLRGGQYAAAIRDSDGELLWRVGDRKLYRETKHFFDEL